MEERAEGERVVERSEKGTMVAGAASVVLLLLVAEALDWRRALARVISSAFLLLLGLLAPESLSSAASGSWRPALLSSGPGAVSRTVSSENCSGEASSRAFASSGSAYMACTAMEMGLM